MCILDALQGPRSKLGLCNRTRTNTFEETITVFPLTPKHRLSVIGEDTDSLDDDKGSSLLWHGLSNDSQVHALLLIGLYIELGESTS